MDRAGILSIARLRLQGWAGFVGGSPRTGQGHAIVPLAGSDRDENQYGSTTVVVDAVLILHTA